MLRDISTIWFVIINPTSAKGKVLRHWDEIKNALKQHDIPCTFVFTQYPLHAISLVQQAVVEGYRHFLGVGGDGLNHEIVNGLIEQQTVPSSELTYTLLPFGTGNDWARMYGIPRDFKKWIAQLPQAPLIFQDIGRLEYLNEKGEKKHRFFTNVAGLAYDGHVVKKLNEEGQLNSKIDFLRITLKEIFNYKLQKAVVQFDGKNVVDTFYTINIGICKYSGGGMQLVPHASGNDGYFALTLVGPLTKLGVLLNTWRFYGNRIAAHPKVSCYKTKSVTIKGLEDQTLELEADGEYLGHTPVKVSILPKAIRIRVPAAYANKYRKN